MASMLGCSSGPESEPQGSTKDAVRVCMVGSPCPPPTPPPAVCGPCQPNGLALCTHNIDGEPVSYTKKCTYVAPPPPTSPPPEPLPAPVSDTNDCDGGDCHGCGAAGCM